MCILWSFHSQSSGWDLGKGVRINLMIVCCNLRIVCCELLCSCASISLCVCVWGGGGGGGGCSTCSSSFGTVVQCGTFVRALVLARVCVLASEWEQSHFLHDSVEIPVQHFQTYANSSALALMGPVRIRHSWHDFEWLSAVILWVSLGGKPKCFHALKFGYHDVMRTSPMIDIRGLQANSCKTRVFFEDNLLTMCWVNKRNPPPPPSLWLLYNAESGSAVLRYVSTVWLQNTNDPWMNFLFSNFVRDI